MEKTDNYLGTEKIGKLLRKFCIPCIISLLISSLYNIVDQIFVGNGVGYLGNAATGIIFPVTVIGWALSLFFGDGTAAYMSVALGKNDTENIHKSVGNSILFSFLSGVVIMLIGYIGGNGLFRLLGATDATVSLAHDYGFIIYTMLPFALVESALSSIIRADGSPRYAMGAMAIGAVINIICDPIAIFVLDMGIKGAAYATILGQFVSFLVCIYYLKNSKSFKLSIKSFLPDFKQLKHTMALGTSSLLTQISIVVVSIISNVLLVKYGALSAYGADIPLAALTVIMKLYQIVLNVALGIATGAQPIVGYNYGAKNYRRVSELFKAIIKGTAIVGIISMVLFEAFPSTFISLFGTSGDLYMEFAIKALRVYLLLILLSCIQKTCTIFLQSIGYVRASAPLAIIRDLLLIVFYLIFPVFFGLMGLLWAAPAADFIAMLITIFVMVNTWKKLKQDENKSVLPAKTPTIQASHPGVVITISREHGSAGKRIGQLLSERMQIPCYYKEVTALAAQESGLATEFISDINKNSPNKLYDLYLNTDVVQQAIIAQDKIIKKIADSGSCVIVGRAADHVLRNYPDLVRIFIYAPKDYRIRKVMEVYGDIDAEARKNVEHSDIARSTYYKSITGTSWADLKNYDLCIDSSIGNESVVEVILKYLNEKGYYAAKNS